jgi:hypothetical protein
MSRYILPVLLSLLSSPVLADINAWNDDSDLNNRVYVRVTNEIVNGAIVVEASAVVTIPPRSYPGQFHFIHLCADGQSHQFVVTPQGSPPPTCRTISAWGTQPRETSLMQQVQTDRHVQFTADYDFDQDFGRNVEGRGTWHKRGNYGGWPAGKTAAIYLRGQAGKRVGGNGQINFAARCDEGSSGGGPPAQMRAQTRGFSSAGNTDAVDDHQRVVISRSHDGQLCVMINAESYGLYLNSGYDLMF